MAVIKVIELVGTSQSSWEDAARNAIKEASETIRDISGLKVINQTATIKDGAITEYRTNVKISFVVADVRD
jgi:flavin-binding protein dodecin